MKIKSPAKSAPTPTLADLKAAEEHEVAAIGGSNPAANFIGS